MTAEQPSKEAMRAERDGRIAAGLEIQQRRWMLSEAEHAYWRMVGAGEALAAVEAGKDIDELRREIDKGRNEANAWIREATRW